MGGGRKYGTKGPADRFTGKGTLEGGNENQRMASAAVSGPLIPELLSARLSVYAGNQDGFIYDTFLQRTLGESDEREGRVTVDHHDGPSEIRSNLTRDHQSRQCEDISYPAPEARPSL